MPSILCYKIEVVIGPLEISKSRCQMASAVSRTELNPSDSPRRDSRWG